MASTPRTTSYLLNTDFTLTGSAGRITPQMIDDFVVSGPQWDAPSGTPIQYGMRGALDGASYFLSQGGIIGTGQSSGQRTTNATALQAAITYASTNNLMFVLAPGVYEILSSTGLNIPAAAYGAARKQPSHWQGLTRRHDYSTILRDQPRSAPSLS